MIANKHFNFKIPDKMKDIREQIIWILDKNIPENSCNAKIYCNSRLAKSNCADEIIALHNQEIEKYTHCASCGIPLSRDCEHCKRLWET
jgi:hypothetical protein